jgi:hypothetical protein
MGSRVTRSAFAAALCAGVAMVGASVHGLLGVDAELERSALAAQHQTIEKHSVRVVAPVRQDGSDCQGSPPAPRIRHRA